LNQRTTELNARETALSPERGGEAGAASGGLVVASDMGFSESASRAA